MAIPKILGAQRDFSAGEIDVSLKRNDEHPARKSGLRQTLNCRILNANTVQNRPGRSALFPISNGLTRIEEFVIGASFTFKIGFGNGRLQIIAAGAVAANFTLQGGGAALPWTTANLNSIVYAVLGLNIYVTFAGMRPQIVSWNGVSTWTISDYNELMFGNQKRTPFYRISPQGINLTVNGGLIGNISIGASQPLFTAGWVGTRIRIINRQILITAFNSTTGVSATVEEPLLTSQQIGFASDPHQIYSVGDVVNGGSTGSKGIITGFGAGNTIFVQLLNQNTTSVVVPASGASGFSPVSGFNNPANTTTTVGFIVSELAVGPAGTLIITATSAVGNPQPTTLWDEEIMNTLHGFPASCFVDNFRLGFCDFPAIPGGIAWSAINAPTDLYVGANPSSAMFEIVPDNAKVRYVLPGPESSEFVFCSNRVFYIPINAASPLSPGNVKFQLLSGDGAAPVQPRSVQEIILYVGAGGKSIMAVIATGAYNRPFNTRNISQFHNHLFSNVIALGAQSADDTFSERYVYALNQNGGVMAGKFTAKEIENNSIVGWGPWSGGGVVTWVSVFQSDVIFTSSYFGVGICEVLDDTQYLDGALPVNNLPASFAPPGGKGPLWFIPSQTVTLMDQVTRVLGTYQIDANGNLIAQNTGGEDLTVASLVAGQSWTMTLEPFIADANPGNSMHQRMFKRRVSRMAVYVENSSGFLMARLFSGAVGANQPAPGTILNQRRIDAYNQGDNPLLPPPLREEVQRWRPLGRSFDPRVAIIKDTPGPLLVAEIGTEASI